jgi:hypothetical protein
MTDKEIEIEKIIGDWYLLEYVMYIRIYGSIKVPHILPRFVLGRLELQEIM